ncbi:MAG: alpha/beta fold hydrolase [Phenylobacterium sp.]|uniref:alpha/beta fold hydrolase n=1 Tax=Phenylobacterium sp. TaxID=1871053 RepID=UPI001A538E5B|nr:alpha/beta fold hydrolase [Phenylobacterium sp.]MBL8555844.1 alpha/beta fold hydrolase [Phenylobacterium sp.]
MSLPKGAHRGERIDIGGRSLRVVRAGPAATAAPLIVCEHGAFGCASDWTVVQERLSAKGLRSLAYDRAGLGYSDPGPEPRDGRAINDDLEALLDRLGDTGPIVLAGHSMGGLMVRLFALERDRRPVVGLVLVDAVTPAVLSLPGGPEMVHGFGRLLQAVSHGARFGLMVPVSLVSANLIGLPGEAAAEKRRIHGAAPHARGASAEVQQWPATSKLAGAVELPPDLPVAVVTADGRLPPPIREAQYAPARASKHGFVEHVTGSTHANVLGPRHADAIVRGLEHVLKAGR